MEKPTVYIHVLEQGNDSDGTKTHIKVLVENWKLAFFFLFMLHPPMTLTSSLC